MKNLLLTLSLCLSAFNAMAQTIQEPLDFKFEESNLSGVLMMPENNQPKGIVRIVHGSGETNAVQQDWYRDVRVQLAKSGYATYMCDKMGCGKSEGVFDYNQPVQNSADEVIAAIQSLKKQKVKGSDVIGLWGISRAGWINPLVIQQYQDINFWISVSGVDGKENFKYLLEQNLKIEEIPQDSVQLLVKEWQAGNRICHKGGGFETYLQATSKLRSNAFYKRFVGGAGTADGYYQFQKQLMHQPLEEVTALPIYIENFESILNGIQCPVLALFGEKDRNVDWKKTRTLYQRTLGTHTNLAIQTFPEANHNMYQCKTGGFYEFQDNKLPWTRCEGFLEAMSEWLEKEGD